jgi:hypothetical protein
MNVELVSLASKTMITWCDAHPEYSGRDLDEVARERGQTLEAAAAPEPAVQCALHG